MTADLKLVWRGKNAKFGVQSDGSKNIFSAIICFQGTDITLNYNNIAYLHDTNIFMNTQSHTIKW